MPLSLCTQTESRLQSAVGTLRALRQRCQQRWCDTNRVDDETSLALKKQVRAGRAPQLCWAGHALDNGAALPVWRWLCAIWPCPSLYSRSRQVLEALDVLSSTCTRASSVSAAHPRSGPTRTRGPHFINPSLDTSLLSSKLPVGTMPASLP